MTTTTLPISLLDSTCIHPVECESIKAQGKRRQADVVVRAKTGDDDAFSELYYQHKRRVFAICMRMVRDFTLAEDLTQEAFLQVHRKIAFFRGDSAFTTWLHRLAVNTVLMHLRKRALAVVSLDRLMEEVPEERAGRGFGARDLMQAGVVDRLDIDRALTAMAPGYRSIFLLHDIQGFDHAEIATLLKCTRGNTKSQLHKARRALRGALATRADANRHANDLFLVPPRQGLARKVQSKHDDVPLMA
jgi:RNA polymerase sigma-70 factor (ECF subfamily)